MRRNLVRALLTLAVFAVVWLVVTPALAYERVGAMPAPLCDPRAAVTFAPPPQFQDPDASLDVVQEEDCSPRALDVRKVSRGRPLVAPSRLVEDPALTLASSWGTATQVSRLGAPCAERLPDAPGVRMAVERPPRASA